MEIVPYLGSGAAKRKNSRRYRVQRVVLLGEGVEYQELWHKNEADVPHRFHDDASQTVTHSNPSLQLASNAATGCLASDPTTR